MRRLICNVLLPLVFVSSAISGSGQTVTNVIDTFATNTYPNGTITNRWSNWFGSAFQSLSLDSASDANGNLNSGSLKIVANFPVVTDQFEVWNGSSGFNPAINGFQFTNLQCDVRFAAGSATNSSGKFGTLEFGVPTPGYGQNYFGNVVVSATNTNWVHVSITLNATSNTNLQNITGLLIHLWGAGLVGPSTLWVDNLQFVGSVSTGTATINYTNTQQRIDGFGASSAWYFSALTTSAADLLFSTNTGAGLSLLRTRIAPGGVIDDSEGTIAQQAVARGARVWSTPWTPPASFKITNSWNRTGNSNANNGGWFSNSVANCQGYASQLANYVSVMKNTYGVNLHALSIQNEPDANVNYESCQWSAKDFHDFLPYLDAALIASNVSSTQIMLPESMHWQFNHATNVMSDVTTSNLVDILGGHNYGSSAAPVTQFGTPCPKTLWETEHYIETDDSITNALAVAQEIHSFLTVAQANAYHYWWLIGSGTGSIADNTANPAKRLFAMGNYSKFIRPNYYRVAVTNTATALVSAYKDPASSNFVVVAANNSAFPVNQTFTLTNFPVVGPLRQWVTSDSEPLANHGGAITLTNGTFATVLPAWTVSTFVYQQPVTNPPSIVQPPANQIALSGDTIAFSVQATGGTAPLYYQWLFNGTNAIPGGTNAALVLTSAIVTNAGYYSVIVTNYAGSVTSSLASLSFITMVWSASGTVSGSNDIATNGTALYAYNNSGGAASVNNVTFTGVNSSTVWGTNVTLGGFSATATSTFVGGANAPWNTLPAGYQTILQGGAYNSGGIATVTLNNLTSGHQYQVQVWVNDSRSGSTTNRTEVLLGDSDSTVTLAYNSTYAVGGVGQFATGTFTATATNQVFTLDGNASTQLNALQIRDVTVLAPSIVQQPTNQATWLGSNATFVVSAGGTAPLFYQWLFNGTNNLPGATNANLTLTGLAATNAGNYSVIITNAGGSITSTVASLTISTDANFVLKTDDTLGNSSFNTSGNWTNSATGAAATFAPASGYTYRTGPFTLRTPATAGNYTFAGNALTVSAGGSLNLKGGSGNIITFNNLILSGTINNSINPNQIAVLAGNLTVAGTGSLNTQAGLNDARGITNNLNLSGSGALTNLGLGTGPGFVAYNGTNTAFTGSLLVISNTTLIASSQTNLGGNPASFNDDQLLLDNGTLQPTASFALNNPNSGVMVGPNGGTFNVGAGISLVISNPIAGNGNLIKAGTGALTLAGTNNFAGSLTVSNGSAAVTGSMAAKANQIDTKAGTTLDLSGMAGVFSVSNKITLAGNLVLDLNPTNASNLAMTASNLVCGGTLTLTNTGPALADGNSFLLFSASNYSGAFASLSPAVPGTGLVWDISRLTVNGTLSVKAPPTVTVVPGASNFIYGTTATLTANATGSAPLTLQWFDFQTNAIATATNVTLVLTPAVTASGNYRVVVSNAIGTATNFSALTVTKATLTVTANNTNRVYATSNPVFTASYTGWVNGDTLGGLSGAPSLATTATSGSSPGNYVISAANGTLAATNYNFTFVNGTLAVVSVSYPTNLTFTADSGTLTLSWPASHLGWTLQAQTNTLNSGIGTNWVDVANSTQTNHASITANPNLGTVFYRLRQ